MWREEWRPGLMPVLGARRGRSRAVSEREEIQSCAFFNQCIFKAANSREGCRIIASWNITESEKNDDPMPPNNPVGHEAGPPTILYFGGMSQHIVLLGLTPIVLLLVRGSPLSKAVIFANRPLTRPKPVFLMRRLALDHTFNIKRVDKGLPLISAINPARSDPLSSTISPEVAGFVARQEPSRM